MTPAQLANCVTFSAGFEAFDAGYFWEAHEIWEPVWMALPPASRERHLLQGVIQLANAALKRAMGKTSACKRILDLADRALTEAYMGDSALIMGLKQDYVATRRAVAAQ